MNVLSIITDFIIGSSSAIILSTVAMLNPSVDTSATSSTALITSITIFTTNECISNLKRRYAKLGECINVITLLSEKTKKKMMIDKKLINKKAIELKKIYNHYLDKQGDFIENTQNKVKDVFCDFLGKECISPEQKTKPNNFEPK